MNPLAQITNFLTATHSTVYPEITFQFEQVTLEQLTEEAVSWLGEKNGQDYTELSEVIVLTLMEA